MPRCDQCPELATVGTHDIVEVPRAPGEWREFKDSGKTKNGCDRHPPVSFVTYSDGRVIRTLQQVPERVPA